MRFQHGSFAMFIVSVVIGCGFWQVVTHGADAGVGRVEQSVVSLGKLDGFWRYSAGLGPYHEGGQGLYVVPASMLGGDFAYKKRPYEKEALFADHLSLVRLLGGFNDEGEGGRDLAYRNEDGVIRYRMELLRGRLGPYVENGYTDLTIVLDNVPWCFPDAPEAGKLGQFSPPRDEQEWSAFIEVLCKELVVVLGEETANGLRFRVGTENGSRKRFDGSHEDYVRHYVVTAAAVRSILPRAKVGCYNISGVSMRGVRELHNVRPIELAETCLSGEAVAPFDWVAYSRYFRPGEDALGHAQTCREVWDAFENAVPKLRGVSREIHEFGIAPWGEVSKGIFASAEPGVLGAALTCQMMLRLREAGIDRLWHWGVLDRYRNRQNRLVEFPTGLAWLMSVLEYMRGGDAYLLAPVKESKVGAEYLALGVKGEGDARLLVSAYHADISEHGVESVTFVWPDELGEIEGREILYTRLNRQSSVHDTIRKDLQRAGLLNADFIERPDRLGNVREMGGRAAENLVGENQTRYDAKWAESLTLKEMAGEAYSIGRDGVMTTITVSVGAPELLVIWVK